MRLEIDDIRFRNIFSFGSKWQEVEFLHGINLVLGIDRERDRSNASGKSSFLETIPFALFGRVNRNVRKDQIVNWKSRKNCEVQINFRKGDTKYTIYRGLKPDKLIVSQNDVDLPIDSKKLDFQKRIEDEILGIDFKTFMSLVYTNINSTAPILTMKKPEKRQFLERVFGLHFIKTINDGSNKKIRNIHEKLNITTVQKEYNLQKVKDAEDQIRDLNKKLKEYDNSVPRLNEERERLLEVNDLINEAEENFSKKSAEIGRLEGKVQYFDFLVSRIGSKKSSLQAKIKILNQQMPDVKDLERELSQLSSLQEEVKKYVSLKIIEDNINAKKSDLEELAELVSRIESDVRKIELEKAALGSLISQDLDQIEKLEKDKVCVTCGQAIKPIVIQKIRQEVNNKESKIKELTDSKMKLQGKIRNIDEKRNVKNEEINGWLRDKEKVVELNSKINSLLHIKEKKDQKEKIRNEIRKYGRALKKLDIAAKKIIEETKDINTKIVLLEESATKSKKIIDTYNGIVIEIERLEEKVKFEEKYKSEIRDLIDKNIASIDIAMKENKDISKKRNKLLHLNDYLQYIKEVCKDEHIKQYAISTNIPYLNKKTNEYLSEVGHGFFVVLDKWLDLEIKGPGISGATYGNLSGGEARGIDLALQMSLLDFARSKAGIFPDILELDELLDSSIDSYGLERVMQIVRMKQETDNLKIFLVSHRKEVSDVNVDRTILVEKVGGYSNIVLQ